MRLFWYKAKAAGFFVFFITPCMSTGKSGRTGLKKLDASNGKICRALTTSVSSFLFQKQKQSKAIVYSTSQQCWSHLLLHNDYTSESVLDSQNAALWVKKKKRKQNNNNRNLKKKSMN